MRKLSHDYLSITGRHYDGEYKYTEPDTDDLNKALKDIMEDLNFYTIYGPSHPRPTMVNRTPSHPLLLLSSNVFFLVFTIIGLKMESQCSMILLI